MAEAWSVKGYILPRPELTFHVFEISLHNSHIYTLIFGDQIANVFQLVLQREILLFLEIVGPIFGLLPRLTPGASNREALLTSPRFHHRRRLWHILGIRFRPFSLETEFLELQSIIELLLEFRVIWHLVQHRPIAAKGVG